MIPKREDALILVDQYLKLDNLKKHVFATEAIMRVLAKRLGKDQDLWGITGLLHDLDYEETKNHAQRHGLVTEQILRDKGINEAITEAIKAHNAEALNIERKTEMDYALTCAETITGLIVATTLVYPDKRIASVRPKSIRKRMKEKAFAQGVDRDLIRLCEKIGIPLDEFIEMSLKAMQEISPDLGL